MLIKQIEAKTLALTEHRAPMVRSQMKSLNSSAKNPDCNKQVGLER